MRSRSSVALAGALLVMLVPGAAGATEVEPATVAVAVADGTVTIRSNDDLVGVLPLDADRRVTVGGVVVAIVDGVLEVTGGTAGDDVEVTTGGEVTIDGSGSDAADVAPAEPGNPSAPDDILIVVDQAGAVATVVDDFRVDPAASRDGLLVERRSDLLDLGPEGSRPN